MSRYSLVLGNKNYSSWSLRPWLVMRHLDLEFEETIVPLLVDGFKEELLKHSASGKVPVLKVEGNEIWDSLAICEYLNDRYPAGQLWPMDEYAKAIARSVSYEMHSGFFNIRNDMPMNMRRIVDGFEPSSLCQQDIERVLEIWESCRERFGQNGPFLFGEFSIADAMFAPVVSRFNTYKIPMSGNVAAYVQTVQDMPLMLEWKKTAIGEAWVIDQVEL